MRRLLVIFLGLAVAILSATAPYAIPRVLAQGGGAYHNNVLGVAFQYPTGWKVREQMPTQTVIAGSEADLDAVGAGRAPVGLLFSLTISTFRQIGADTIDDFSAILKRIAQTDTAATPIRIAGTDGQAVDWQDTTQDIATRTVILSIGKRRVAVIRGVATVASWSVGGSEGKFNDLTATLSFFPPPGLEDTDSIGRMLWQVPTDKLGSTPQMVDLSLSPDGSTLYVTDLQQGIWQINTNGVATDKIVKLDGVGSYAGISTFSDGTQYIADPVNHILWWTTPDGKARKLVGGEVGKFRGQFGPTSPRLFAMSTPRAGKIFVLDENDAGLRIQVIGRGGDALVAWDLSTIQSTKIEAPVIARDSDNSVFVSGSNMTALIKVNAAGTLVQKDFAAAVLHDSGGVLGLVTDRFDNLFVATGDQGILKIGPDGKLMGVIGQPSDQSAPPKPGQVGKPTSMIVNDTGNVLFVIDGGKFPQVVAFTLDGNTQANLAAGTKDGGTLTYGQTVSGEITVETFVYTYSFDAKKGDLVTITMKAGDGSKLDAYLDLIGPDKQRIAANDDAKVSDLGPTDAQIKDFKVPADGTYVIRATRFGRETTAATGTFSLTLESKAQ